MHNTKFLLMCQGPVLIIHKLSSIMTWQTTSSYTAPFI